MAIQHRRGNFADFDPYKMRPGEWAFPLDRGEGYYCISPGDVRRVATKEEIIEILETSQEAYDGLQQLLTELEDETVATGILADISQLLDDVAINKIHIADNTQDIINLDTKIMSQLAEKASKEELNALGQLKLSGVYSTLTELQTAYPTGTTGLFLVTADGYTYRWNNTSWVKAAQFQSTGIGEKSIGMRETKYPMAEGIPSKNLFTTEWEIGGFYSATGLPWDGTTQIRTKDFITVKPSTQYVVSDPERVSSTSANAQYVFAYDANKNFISKTEIRPNTTATYTTSSETYFIKLQSQSVGVQGYVIGDYANFKTQIEEGSSFTGYETPYPKTSVEALPKGAIGSEYLTEDVRLKLGGLPSYYETEKQQVIERVYNKITSPKNAVFGLIADIQSDTGQEYTKNMLENYTNINYLCRDLPVSFIANLGDFINGVSPKATTLEELKKYTSLVINTTPVPYFITKGNHDDNSGYTINNGNLYDELITNEEWYKYVIKYFERYPQFVFDDENRQGGYCYFDDHVSKIRFIFINTYETAYIKNPDGTSKYDAMHNPAISDKQIQWLAHKAFNFMDKPDKEEWATLGFAHYVHGATKNYSLLINIINAYNKGISYTGSTSDEDYASSVSVDYSQQGQGEFITFICGDSHRDWDFQHLLYDIHQMTVLSSYYPAGVIPRATGTDTQDSFNIVVVDRENKLIKLTRFGAGEDRVMNYADYTPKYFEGQGN